MSNNAASFIRTSVPQIESQDIGSKVSDSFMQSFQTSYDMKRQRGLDDLNKKRTLQLMDLDTQMMPLKIRSEDLDLQKAKLDLKGAGYDVRQKEIELRREEEFLDQGGDPDKASSGLDNPYRQKKNSEGIKLSNYGYDSDSSPDYNSNVLRIGHADNKLVDGESAALTKSLADRYGLKSGDMFEATTEDGKKITRRYDDTVPNTYKGKPLPETVDLYNQNGSNSFGGKVIGIKPLGKKAVAKRDNSDLDLPAGPFGGINSGMVLPPRGAI